jgi:FAD/FMN-containing dehydrogenase/Fe-S oxidoreductase
VDERRAHIHDDLRGLIAGDLHFAPIARGAYARDSSLYEIDPLGVVVPRSVDDLKAVVRYASERGISLHARGAGTGLAGESLGAGLVVDFSRYLRRVIEIGSDFVVVQPGVVLDRLNAQLESRGRKLGPDPGGAQTCTIGGMIGGNSAGSRSLRHGVTADHVQRLRVLFANGEQGDLKPEPWPSSDDEPGDFQGMLLRRVALHLRWHGDLIARSMPRSPRNRAGYALSTVASAEGLNLARLIVGSEGTLALVTEARLATVPIAAAALVVLLPFRRLADAADAVSDCLKENPSACDLIDWRRLSLARETSDLYSAWIPDAAEAALVVELEGDDPGALEKSARSLIGRLRNRRTLVAEPVEAIRRQDRDLLMNLRRVVAPMLWRSPAPERPLPLIEDVSVPVDQLRAYLAGLQRILKSHEVNWTIHAHAGDGQVHARPFLNMSDPLDRAKLEPISRDVHDFALALGGTISGEHGCGLVRSQFLKRQYGELAAVFREIKYAFDPLNLLNPGKVVCDDPHLLTHSLRSTLPPVEDGAPENADPFLVLNNPLNWNTRSRRENLTACNGCGECRSQEPSLRMCPSFRALRSEAAAPRAQVNLLHEIASGVIEPRFWGSEELRANAVLCVHCQLCRTECPAGIDVSSLMVEAKAAYVENHGLTPTDWMLSRVEIWSKWASRVPLLSNALLANRGSRWGLERLFGLSRHRLIPKAHRWPFLGRAERRGWTKPRPQEPGPRVAYFVDLFANYFDQELAESVVAVLRHAGVNVYVPAGQRGCGMPALVAGDLDHARDLLLQNLRILGNAVRDGYTIVCSEPTAALMLRHESLRLTDDLDAALVASNTMDVGEYLAGLAARGQLPQPEQPLHAKVGYHQPCHLRALQIGTPGLDLIREIPGLEVEFIDRGCSGIAGTFGLARKNFRNSLRAGRGLRSRLRDPDLELGATECGACRMQMEQGSTKRTMHPIKLLAAAQGLNPSLKLRFKAPKPRHILS